MGIWDQVLAACATALTGVVVAVGAFAVQYIQQRTREIQTNQKRKAIDDAVAAVEEKSRMGAIAKGTAKVAEAIRLADEATPRSVTITPDDVQAGVTRLRASMPASSLFTSSFPPPPQEN